MHLLRSIWNDIITPSARDESAYDTVVIAMAHVLLGAAAMVLLSHVLPRAALYLVIPLAYWIGKETVDIGRKGSLLDSIADAGFVLLGTLYAGPTWWPVAACCSAAAAPFLMRSR